jgi:O-antigen/teichoic acid export membrane protein
MDRSFLKHAAFYGLAALLVQAGGFVLLPIYLRCLTPEEYGLLEVVGRLAETMGTCLLFSGFRQALMTFYQQTGDESERRKVVSATFLLVGGSCFAGGAAALLFSPSLGRWLAPDLASDSGATAPFLLRLAVLGILLEPLCLIPLALVQARTESTVYAVVVLGQFLVRVALCILLVRYLHWGVMGTLTATAATGALFGLTLSARELSKGAAWPGLRQLRELLAFSLPMLPGGACFFVLHHGDRFFLLHYCSTGEVGLYGLGYKLAMVVGSFSLAPLYMVWSARMYAVAEKPGAGIVFGRVFTRILAAYLFVGLGLCLFAEEVVLVLGGPSYRAAAAIVPAVVFACFFQSASSLMDAGFYVRRRTGIKLALTLATTVVMLVLYRALIPVWSSHGAALATLGGFCFLASITFFVTQRLFPVQYEWFRLAALVVLTAGLWLMICTIVSTGPLGFAVRVVAWLSAPLIAWAIGLVNREEAQYVGGLLDRLRLLMQHRSANTGTTICYPPSLDFRRALPLRLPLR